MIVMRHLQSERMHRWQCGDVEFWTTWQRLYNLLWMLIQVRSMLLDYVQAVHVRVFAHAFELDRL